MKGSLPEDFPFLPFTEALNALKKRGHDLVPTKHWTEMWQGAHLTSFTVARSAGYDILGDVHSALVKGQEQGLPFSDFKKQLMPILQKKGWWGIKDGEQLGSVRRLQTIYDVNMRVSAAQGNWERQQRLKENRPYLRYVALLDGKTRPLHRLWNGIVLPVDHAWWKTHYPPNGWRCRCGAEDLSEDDLERFGYKVTEHVPEDMLKPWVNPVSGEIAMVPEGIDPGWNYNPGGMNQAVHAARVAMDKLAGLPPSLGAEVLEILAQGLPEADLEAGGTAPRTLRKVVKAGLANWMAQPRGNFPVAIILPDDAARIGSSARVVKLSPDTLAKQWEHHPELRAEDYIMIQDAVEKGEKYQQGESKLTYKLNRAGGIVVIVKATRVGDEIFLVSMWKLSGKERDRERVGKKDKKITD